MTNTGKTSAKKISKRKNQSNLMQSKITTLCFDSPDGGSVQYHRTAFNNSAPPFITNKKYLQQM